MKITLAMITFNEEDRIGPALESAAGVVDEIVVVDSGSSDRTREIAGQFGARIINRSFIDFADQKNFVLNQAACEWVLNLDADERISDQLRAELLKLKAIPRTDVDGFRIRRRAFYLGRWIRHSGWYPDKKLRLFQKEKAKWQGKVHERLVLQGTCGELAGHILHYTYRDMADHVTRINHYTSMQAESIAASRQKLLILRALLLPPVTFLRHYVWRLGFLDGMPGLVIALISSWGTASKFLKAAALRSHKK